VALLLPELVGPTGAVVGVDPNSEILSTAWQRAEAAGSANVTFVEGDVRTTAIEGGAFDAAVGRFVLIWVHNPVEVLRACAARVRAGGVVAFQETDTLGSYRAVPPSDVLERWHSAVTRSAAWSLRSAAIPKPRPGPAQMAGHGSFRSLVQAWVHRRTRVSRHGVSAIESRLEDPP